MAENLNRQKRKSKGLKKAYDLALNNISNQRNPNLTHNKTLLCIYQTGWFFKKSDSTSVEQAIDDKNYYTRE